MQTQKYGKEFNSASARGVLCAQGARRESRLKAHQHCSWLNHFSLTRINPVNPKIIQTPNRIVYLFY